MYIYIYVLSHSIMSDSLQLHGYSPPGSSILGDSPGKNAGVGCHSLLQGDLPNPGIEPRSAYCRRILYQLSHQGSPCEDTLREECAVLYIDRTYGSVLVS